MRDSVSATTNVNETVEFLRQGGVVAIPTDTVYGLAAALDCPVAIDRIYRLKRRDTSQPIPVLISSRHLLNRFGRAVSPVAGRVADRFWPGAITIIVQASEIIPGNVRAGGTTVGLRMPANELTLQVIERTGGGIAVTSANRSRQIEARSAEQVSRIFGNELDYILDGGMLTDQPASTVLDLSAGTGVIRREGAIDRNALSTIDGVFN